MADVAGFSQLVGRDEDGTLQRLQHLRNDVADPIIRARSGRIIKSLGDGILAEFASVAEAVQAATEIRRDRHAQRSSETRCVDRIPYRHS
ncbi:MAG: hypothetical protein WA851_14960 [Xanthobacteraceae bacterium]